MATRGVLLKKMDSKKQVVYRRNLAMVREPSVPKAFRATQSTTWDFSTAPITRYKEPIVISAELENPVKENKIILVLLSR